MTIHIEICKSSWGKDKWNIRVGDIAGSSEHSNISKEELINEIKEQLNIEETEEKL